MHAVFILLLQTNFILCQNSFSTVFYIHRIGLRNSRRSLHFSDLPDVPHFLNNSKVEQKDWNNAETSLFDYEEGTIGSYSEELVAEPENMPEIMLNSRIQHLIAKVNEAADRKDAAATHYCDAVAMDRHAISSLRAMSEKRLLTSDETEEFLDRLSESNSNSQDKSKENIEMMNVFKLEFDQNGSQEHIFNFRDVSGKTSNSHDTVRLWKG